MSARIAGSFLVTAALFVGAPSSQGQAPAGVPTGQPAPALDSSPRQPARESDSDPMSGNSKFLGKDVPVFDPGSELMTWDGKTWNINNNRLVRARLEKYLNAAEENTEEDRRYRATLEEIKSILSSSRTTSGDVDRAWELLRKAAAYDGDARLCDSIADAVYSVWLSQKESRRLRNADDSMVRERRALEWNSRMASEYDTMGSPNPKNAAAAAIWAKQQEQKQQIHLQPMLKRMVEIEAVMKANQVKREASLAKSKIEFQALNLQLFIQRRFEHVIIANKFYRAVFGDGDTALNIKKDAGSAGELFGKLSALPPTLGVLDSLANEAIRDVRQGIDAYRFLLEKQEMASASQRLAETFALGEFMSEVRTLPRDLKRRALAFVQKGNQLQSALEVKDYDLAEKLVGELQEMAKDFDASKPLAAVETARKLSDMHLAKAKTAAASGDRITLETELREATKLWPRNPRLAEVSTIIFNQADVQQQALADLDRLISQKNFRQVFDDRVRFIAATALYPERQQQLRKVLEDMQAIEGGIMRAEEVGRRGDYAGAWETLKSTAKDYPDDVKLNQMLADFTTRAATFVNSLQTAQELESKNQTGSSLAWYLKAQKNYPASTYAREGIDRLVKQVIPEG
jgi:hypothetical protein